MVKNLENRTLRVRAYNAIKKSILSNEMLPGQVFSIGSLAGELGISETPVREALVMIKAEGFIEHDPHKKPLVARITEEDVRQAYEIRKLLEPYAASLVIAAMSKDRQVKSTLEKLLEQAESLCNTTFELTDYGSHTSIDLKLNDIFLQASKKTLFREIFNFVSARSHRIRTFVEAVSKKRPTNIIHTITKEHIVIIQAILEGDENEVKRVVCQHLLNAEARTLEEIGGYKQDP
jgi:GntR family transcriptional regulator, rspAB operon transcriptional repressor